MADHDMSVEQDAADIGAKSYIWKYCADNSCHGEKGDSKNLQRKFCDRKLTEMSTTRAQAVAHTLVYVGRSLIQFHSLARV